jgi:pyruvate,water dikinase
VPAAPGRHTGPVRVVRHFSQFDQVRPGDVVVCPATDPSWSVLFGVVGAIVTEGGGALSHAAIVAREHGVPAVLAVGGATNALHDGQLVTVDGTAGTVALAVVDSQSA